MYSLCYKYAPCVAMSVIKAHARGRMRAHVARWLLHVPLGKELPGRWEGGVGERGGGESVLSVLHVEPSVDVEWEEEGGGVHAVSVSLGTQR